MDDEQFKQKLRTLFCQDLTRRVAIDTLLEEASQKGLIATLARKYVDDSVPCCNLFTTRTLASPDTDEPDRLQLLRPILVQFCRSVNPELRTFSGIEQVDPSDEAIDETVRHHLLKIDRRWEAWQRYHGPKERLAAEPSNQIFLDAPKPRNSLSAINDWSSATETPSSLKILSQNALMNEIRQSLVGAKASAAFCCGGSVVFREAGSERQSTNRTESGPVTLRWDDKDLGSGKMVFSPASSGDPQFHEALNRLCHSSQPASFGRDGKDVFDESYRQATKLDATEFVTNFHPHDCGILGELENILLPSYLGDDYRAHGQSICAELYKLNIYSGPGGLFKSHVDTPRSETQFASLVVCLPSAHEGGALVLRHNGRSFEFDWSGPAPTSIQWAAFYSDCEHEVLPLECGHRITLTYNLYYRTTQPHRALPLPVHSFPIYHDLQAALQTPGFMGDGGTLGFYCNHAYAHSNAELRQDLPMALKGVDMLIYAVCRSLGLVAKARPIIELESWEDYYSDSCSDSGAYPSQEYAEKVYKRARGRLRDFQKDGFHVPPYKQRHMKRYNEIDGDDNILPQYQNTTDNPADHPLAQHDLTLEYRKLDRQVRLQQDHHAPLEPEAKIEYLKSRTDIEGLVPSSDPHTVEVGSKFHRLKVARYACDSQAWLRTKWPSDLITGIQWVTERKHEELAMAYAAYGNNATTECKYSAAAILVIVPPWSPERGENGDGTATISVATDFSVGRACDSDDN